MSPGAGLGDDFTSVLVAAQSGAEWAFAVIYRDQNPRLLRYFASAAPQVAEDLTAETWLAAARQLRGFRGEERAFRGWLFTIAHGCLVQHWRDTKRQPFQAADHRELPETPDRQDVEADVAAMSAAAEAARQLVSRLTRDQAQVVLLRVLGDLDVGQVATILGKRPGAVRALQHKALRRLAGQTFFLEGVTK